jgi:hypothetical protein
MQLKDDPCTDISNFIKEKRLAIKYQQDCSKTALARLLRIQLRNYGIIQGFAFNELSIK